MLAFLEELGITRGTLLVVPDFHGRWPLDAHLDFCARLRETLEAGWELALHGFTHLDDSSRTPTRLKDRLAGRYLTDREGEFLLLGEGEAGRRLADGKALLRRVLGQSPVGFVPPAWLCGPAARRAVAESGLAYSEDHLRLLDLRNDIRHICPALGWASRSPGRRRSSILGATLLVRPLSRLPTVRVALHPGDFGYQALIASIRWSLKHFLGQGFTPMTVLEALG